MEDAISSLSAKIAGQEREIIDDYCRAFIANKSLEGLSVEYIINNYTLNIQHCQKEGKFWLKYWLSLKEG